MEKNVFLTKTGLSAIAGFAVLMFGLFGIDMAEEEMEKALTAIAGVITAVGVIYGRIKADKKATLKKPGGGSAGALLLALMLIPALAGGCAVKDMKPYEQASSVSYELMGVYLKAHDTYLEIYNEASPGLKEALAKDVAPYYNTTKSVLIELGDLSQAWRLTQEKPGEWDALLQKAQEMVPRLASKLNAVLKEYSNG